MLIHSSCNTCDFLETSGRKVPTRWIGPLKVVLEANVGCTDSPHHREKSWRASRRARWGSLRRQRAAEKRANFLPFAPLSYANHLTAPKVEIHCSRYLISQNRDIQKVNPIARHS
jgi:hypothetical protein